MCSRIAPLCRPSRGPALLGAFVVMNLLAGVVSAQGLPAETWPQKVVVAYVDAFNADGPDAMRSFIESYRSASSLARRPIEDRISEYEQMRKMMGDLEPYSILEEEVARIAVLVRASNLGTWLRLFFQLEPDPPHKITMMGMMPAAAPEDEGLQAGTDEPLAEVLRRVCTEKTIPAIGAARIDTVGITEIAVVGSRRFGEDVPVGQDDLFHVGSVAKSMTATMIGALVDAGKLRFETTLAEVFGDSAVDPRYEEVTIEELLWHRAGVPAMMMVDDEEDRRLQALGESAREQRALFVAEILAAGPEREPGESWAYSNAGYSVAACAAETVTGHSWEELMRVLVFDPLRMETAGFGWPATVERPDQPRGHLVGPEGLTLLPLEGQELGYYLAPAGDVHCSTRDLARYVLAHLQGLRGHDGIVRASTMVKLHQPPAIDDGSPRYAMGWMILEREGEPVHEHSGSAGSFFALLQILPKSGRGVVVLMNSGSMGNDAIARQIADLLLERAMPADG